MHHAFIALVALAAADAAPPPSGPSVISFRTEVSPRVDPVFGDVDSLREAVDQFLSLQGDMERLRDEFATAVHDTLAQLAPASGRTRGCPMAVSTSYARALEAGRRFLRRGHRLEGRFREIRRGDELGDTVGLTPDYRFKVKKVRELYLALVRDLREMKFAFHEQLGAELRHAGCQPLGPRGKGEAGATVASDPADPAAWEMEPAEDAAPASREGRGAKLASGDAPAPAVAPAVWIEVDNSRCAQPSTLVVDGLAVGEIGGEKKVSVRTRAGPHELCILPASDKRTCGAPGTVRRAYLYEGFTLAVRCER